MEYVHKIHAWFCVTHDVICRCIQTCDIVFRNIPKFLYFSGSGIALTDVVQGVLSIILHRITVLCCVDKLDRKRFGHSVQSSSCAKLSLVSYNLVSTMLTFCKNSKVTNELNRTTLNYVQWIYLIENYVSKLVILPMPCNGRFNPYVFQSEIK